MSTHSVTPSVHLGCIADQILTVSPDVPQLVVTAEQIYSALLGKSPIVGIPLEGREPLRLDRKRLAGALKGVSIVEITLTLLDNAAWLKVEGVSGPRVRTSFSMPSYARLFTMRTLREWSDSQARKIAKPKTPAGKGSKEIARLERELSKLGTLHKLPNPTTYEPYHSTVSESVTAQTMRWRAEKPRRTLLGSVIQSIKGESTTKIYARLESLAVIMEIVWWMAVESI